MRNNGGKVRAEKREKRAVTRKKREKGI